MRSGISGFIPERLVEARDSRGLTQVALAELINRTSSSISRWEAGGEKGQVRSQRLWMRLHEH